MLSSPIACLTTTRSRFAWEKSVEARHCSEGTVAVSVKRQIKVVSEFSKADDFGLRLVYSGKVRYGMATTLGDVPRTWPGKV